MIQQNALISYLISGLGISVLLVYPLDPTIANQQQMTGGNWGLNYFWFGIYATLGPLHTLNHSLLESRKSLDKKRLIHEIIAEQSVTKAPLVRKLPR